MLKQILIFLIVISCIGCCSELPVDSLGFDTTTKSIKLAGGQKMIRISYNYFDQWIREHQEKIKVVTITDVGDEVYGACSSFIVVYEEI